MWDMLTKKDVATVEHAHKLEINAICNFYGHPGTSGLDDSSKRSQNPLDNSCFITGGSDGCVKAWELHNDIVRLLYVIQLEGVH